MYDNMVIGGFLSGHIRIFNAQTGRIQTEIAAHARAINALDVHRSEPVV